jgi:hypothetical protein
MPAERSVALVCHPESRSAAVRGVRARVRRSAGGALAVAFTIDGDIGRLRVPEPKPPHFADRLWEHACCEVFVACKGAAAYHEFNLAPSGEWAAFAFRGYRERVGADATGLEPHVAVRSSASALELAATLRLDLVSREHASGPLALGLSAVIEDDQGSLSYWALAHPPGKPDFHHTAAFALAIG